MIAGESAWKTRKQCAMAGGAAIAEDPIVHPLPQRALQFFPSLLVFFAYLPASLQTRIVIIFIVYYLAPLVVPTTGD